MKKKDYFRLVLILAIFFLALGGWLLHLRIHPIAKDAENYIPLVAGFISVFLIPILFIFRSTISFAYLLNGMTVIIGTITMTHFSIENHPPVCTLPNLILLSCAFNWSGSGNFDRDRIGARLNWNHGIFD